MAFGKLVAGSSPELSGSAPGKNRVCLLARTFADGNVQKTIQVPTFEDQNVVFAIQNNDFEPGTCTGTCALF